MSVITLKKIEKRTFYFEDLKKNRVDLGGSRMVCKYRNICVKVGDQGKQEIEIFNDLTEEEKPYYVPIIDHGKTEWKMGDWDMPTKFTWVAQPWLNRIIKTSKFDIYTKEWKELYEATAKRNLVDIDYFFSKGRWVLHNWTVINGRPVCYDYGF